jgi:hypothetical protein
VAGLSLFYSLYIVLSPTYHQIISTGASSYIDNYDVLFNFVMFVNNWLLVNPFWCSYNSSVCKCITEDIISKFNHVCNPTPLLKFTNADTQIVELSVTIFGVQSYWRCFDEEFHYHSVALVCQNGVDLLDRTPTAVHFRNINAKKKPK